MAAILSQPQWSSVVQKTYNYLSFNTGSSVSVAYIYMFDAVNYVYFDKENIKIYTDAETKKSIQATIL